jgi:hypothetical protein
MDVSPCNPLLDLWFVALVLSKTLNGSSIGKEDNSNFLKTLKAGRLVSGLFFWKIFFTFLFFILTSSYVSFRLLPRKIE